MHNIVEGGGGRMSEEEGKMNFFQPRHSPLSEHRTLRSSFNFLSRFSPAWKTRYMKTVFPFSLFFFSSTRKNHRRRPSSFHRFKLFSYYRMCLLNFSHHTFLLQPLLDEGTKPQKGKFFLFAKHFPGENESFSLLLNFCLLLPGRMSKIKLFRHIKKV